LAKSPTKKTGPQEGPEKRGSTQGEHKMIGQQRDGDKKADFHGPKCGNPKPNQGRTSQGQ